MVCVGQGFSLEALGRVQDIVDRHHTRGIKMDGSSATRATKRAADQTLTMRTVLPRRAKVDGDERAHTRNVVSRRCGASKGCELREK
jgi:hypothetical protein